MTRKSRVAYAFIHIFHGRATLEGNRDTYYGVVAYDKKSREIPSSVNCCFNGDYYQTDQIVTLAQAL